MEPRRRRHHRRQHARKADCRVERILQPTHVGNALVEPVPHVAVQVFEEPPEERAHGEEERIRARVARQRRGPAAPHAEGVHHEDVARPERHVGKVGLNARKRGEAAPRERPEDGDDPHAQPSPPRKDAAGGHPCRRRCTTSSPRGAEGTPHERERAEDDERGIAAPPPPGERAFPLPVVEQELRAGREAPHAVPNPRVRPPPRAERRDAEEDGGEDRVVEEAPDHDALTPAADRPRMRGASPGGPSRERRGRRAPGRRRASPPRRRPVP